MMQTRNKKITIVYGSGVTMTGQRFASDILSEGLKSRGWRVRVIHTPLLDRVNEIKGFCRMFSLAQMGFALLSAWLKGAMLTSRRDIFYVNMGQTKFSMIRDGFPLIIMKMFSYPSMGILSLHGSWFMGWREGSFEAKLLRYLAESCFIVTVLGPNHQKKIIEFGIPFYKARQIDNTCILRPVVASFCEKKQINSGGFPLRVLMLTNLMEAKGYIEFVEAIRKLSENFDISIKATLCGKVVSTGEDQKFESREAVKKWLNGQIGKINLSHTVRIEWIEGVCGEKKESLFRDAHIFILPSYREAQPITLIEAMASGSAIIASRVGEIPSMVTTESALLLSEITAHSIALAIARLKDGEKRLRLAKKGLELFEKRFSYEKHLDNWETLITSKMSKNLPGKIY